MPRVPLPGAGAALPKPGAPLALRARPAACLTFSRRPAALPARRPGPDPGAHTDPAGSPAATTAARRPPPTSPPRAGRGQARTQPPGPDSGCHRRLRLSRIAHDAPGSRSPRGSARSPGTPSSSRARRLGPGQDKMAAPEEDPAFPARPAPR